MRYAVTEGWLDFWPAWPSGLTGPRTQLAVKWLSTEIRSEAYGLVPR